MDMDRSVVITVGGERGRLEVEQGVWGGDWWWGKYTRKQTIEKKDWIL